MTKEELEKRVAQTGALPEEEMTDADQEAFSLAGEEDDWVSLTDFRRELEGYSGKVVLRMPRSLHKKLKERAKAEGVSLNQYMIYKLAQ